MEDSSPPPEIPRICTSCGSQIEPGHKFCEICGAETEELPVCSTCGALFLAPVKFCELCGTPVVAPETVLVASPEPEAETQPEDKPIVEPEVIKPAPEPEFFEPESEPELPKRTPISAAPPIEEKKIVAKLAPDPIIPEERDRPAPKRSPINFRPVLGGVIILILIIAGVYFVGLPLLKGNTAITAPPQPPAPVNTPAPELATLTVTMPPTISTPVPPTPDNSLLPQQTQKIPKNQEVFFDVQKDGITNQITVIYQRGPGENILRYAEITVTHPDGTILTGTITPSRGETERTLDGSRLTDRVEVIAHMHTGQDYRIKDELLT